MPSSLGVHGKRRRGSSFFMLTFFSTIFLFSSPFEASGGFGYLPILLPELSFIAS